MGTHQPIRKVVTPEIPDKLYFRIGDVARLCEVPTYVLRFWETEFSQLKPNKGGTGQRLYRRRDVEWALRIKSLLYDQGYTIPGARQVFKNEAAARSAESAAQVEAVPLASNHAPVMSAPIAAQTVDHGPAFRQNARLRELREEMAALLAELSPTPAARERQRTEAEPKVQEPKVQMMRPRLMLEPRAAVAKNEGQGSGARLHLAQRDLFAGEPASMDEWPEPPVAS